MRHIQLALTGLCVVLVASAAVAKTRRWRNGWTR